MSRPISHEDLVALAMGGLEPGEAQEIRDAAAADPELAAELTEVESHLGLHDDLPALAPTPALWRNLNARLEAESAPIPAPSQGTIKRFWMPIAAAALVAAAFLFQRGEKPAAPTTLHGDVAQLTDGRYACKTVSRLSYDDVVITMDAGTVIKLENQRLALDAGRVHLRVPKNRRGFTVDAGELRVVTTGTVFWVDRQAREVGVTEGAVRVGDSTVAAGETYGAGAVAKGARTPLWMSRPTLTGNLTDTQTVTVVIRNDMPDSIELALPTGGEPLFYGHADERDFPLELIGDLASPSIRLDPAATTKIKLRLPRPLKDREAFFVDYPAAGIRVEATR